MTWLWLRLGDNAEYEKYDSLEDVKEFFKELRLTMDFKRHGGYGVKNEEYYGENYISLFWGDDEAQPKREISNRELISLNRDRRMSPQLSERKRIRRNPLGYKGFDSYTAYGIILGMHIAIDDGYGKIPYKKRVGNWEYDLDAGYILHIRYYGTEVITADFRELRVIKVTTGGYGSVSTKAGISKALYALERLGYSIPPERGSKYERNPKIRRNSKSPTLSFKNPKFTGDPFKYYKKHKMPYWGSEYQGVYASFSHMEKVTIKRVDLDNCQQVWLGEKNDWLKEVYRCPEWGIYVLTLKDNRVVIEKI